MLITILGGQLCQDFLRVLDSDLGHEIGEDLEVLVSLCLVDFCVQLGEVEAVVLVDLGQYGIVIGIGVGRGG